MRDQIAGQKNLVQLLVFFWPEYFQDIKTMDKLINMAKEHWDKERYKVCFGLLG